MTDGFVEQGIGLTTIGVGLSFDVALMRGLAEHGAGNFYFLEDAAAATESRARLLRHAARTRCPSEGRGGWWLDLR